MFDDPYKYYSAPHISNRFIRGLERIGGFVTPDLPRFKCVWGHDELVTQKGIVCPRFVGSKRMVTKEVQTEAGIYHKAEDLELYGTSRWFILEYHDHAEWAPQGIEAARKIHARLRYQNWRLGFDKDGNLAPVADDILGEFNPVRYKFMCKLETVSGEYVQPSQFWLDVIKRTVYARDHSKYVSVDAATKAICDELEADRKKASDLLWDEAEDELKIHVHRLVDPARVNKGGQRADRIILTGSTD
ncbi:MAG: hypothetical protein WBV94_21760 [Blastocatellia bacterium]